MRYQTYRDVIRNWPGGPKGMAQDLDVPVSKVSSWANKDILPVCYWTRLIDATHRRQFFGVDYHVLAKIAERDLERERKENLPDNQDVGNIPIEYPTEGYDDSGGNGVT